VYTSPTSATNAAELRACPGDGQTLDLVVPAHAMGAEIPAREPRPGDPTTLARVHRLALSRAAVGRTAGVIELTRRAAR
jgi:hypothetical protein